MRIQWQHSAMAVMSVAAPWLVTLLIGGCVASATPAAADRGTNFLTTNPALTNAWPERYPEPLRDMLKDDADFSNAESLPITAEPVHAGMLRLFRISTEEVPERTQRVYGNGVIHAVENVEDGTIRMMYVTNRLPPEQFDELANENVMLDDPRADHVLRWRLMLQPPFTEDQRGLIIHLPSIGDRKYENAVNDALRERGWSILTVMPPALTIRIIESGADVSPPVVTTGESLAMRLDDFAADYAYAVEDSVAYLRTWHEWVRSEPIVIVGYSAGSLAASTIAARLHDDVEAAIFIGGGANVAGILMESTAAKLGVRLRLRHGAKVEHELAELPDSYLRASRFDPYYTAPALSTRPVLLVEGRFDQIIPAQYRELLYERLDRPERWTYPLGHVLLFWMLPRQANAIATWLDEAVEPRHNATPID